MENLITGIATITITVIGFSFAYFQLKKNKTWNSLLLIIACGFLLRIYVSADGYLHTWDEKYHALVAKNLIKHPLRPTLYDDPVLPYDHKEWTSNHIWLSKPPFPLWVMAISINSFGTNEFAVRLPSIIFSSISILLTFIIGSILFSRKIGLFAAFFHSIHGMLIEATGGRISSDHVEICFVFLVELSVLFALFSQNKKNRLLWTALCGVAAGASVLSKMLPGLLVIPMWLYLSHFIGRLTIREIALNFSILIVSSMAVFLPWFVYCYYAFPAEAGLWFTSFISPMTSVIHEHRGPAWYYLDNIKMAFGELILIPLAWCAWKMFRTRGHWKLFLLGLWIFIPFIIFSFAETKRPTYLLISAPAIFILTAYFWKFLRMHLHRFRPKFLVIIVLVGLFALPIRYSIERIKPFHRVDRHPEWTEKVKRLDSFVNTEKVVILNTPYPVEIMYYTNFIAYPYVPSQSLVNEIRREGYAVFLWEDLEGL